VIEARGGQERGLRGLAPAYACYDASAGGPDKKTLYAVANDRRIVEVYAIPEAAQGHRGRAK
jgi:hypothetical protein